MNIVRVAEVAAQECVRQQVGLLELANLIDAYRIVSIADNAFTHHSQFESLAAVIEPIKNRNGFRNTPVTFRNGGSSADANDPRYRKLLETLDKPPGVK